MQQQDESMFAMSRDLWKNSLGKLFNSPIPETATWTNTKEIANALNIFQNNSMTYCFFPDGGGIHLGAARPTDEENCIEVCSFDRENNYEHANPYIIKAKKLYFFKPGKDENWSYFILEADSLHPVLEYDEDSDKPQVHESVIIRSGGFMMALIIPTIIISRHLHDRAIED
jgi:hypothetical protein